MADGSYSGPIRILDITGNLLAIGVANLEEDPENHSWRGVLELMSGTGVAGKALVVDLEADGRRGRAQLLPTDNKGDTAHSRVVGLGPQFF
jgi:hypothetical protein